MSEWKKVKLGDIASAIQTGPFGSQLHQSDYSDIGVPVVMPKDIINGRIDESAIARVESHHVERLSRHKISEGDILYARRGDVGKCAYTVFAQQGWLCGTGCLRVTIDKEKAFPKFIFFQLQKRETIGWVEKHAIGATMLNLNTSILGDVPIELPPLYIQHHIATILSRYDSLIENYQKQIKLLEEAAQRLYKEWFVDLHFPGHENTKIVNGVPEGWEKKTLDSFCNIFTGKKNANQGVPNGEYKFFTCGDTPLLINSFIYDGPAIIISGNGSYTGRTTFYEGKFDLYQRTYACTIKDTKNRDLIYGLYEIVKCELTNKISGGTHGAAIPYIVMSDLTKFDFLFNDSIMHRFSTTVKKLLSISLKLSNNIRLLTEARDRLLPKLMSGEIAV